MMYDRLWMVFVAVAASGCGPGAPTSKPPPPPAAAAPPPAPAPASVADDAKPAPQSGYLRALEFLEQHAEVVVLEAEHGARVVVSPKYQARVMTSAVNERGQSLGWLNEKFIEAGKTGTQFDNYGGEDRFWLGPEAGQYGLYFPKAKPFEFAHWQTPAAFQEGAWEARERSATQVTFERPMEVENYQGTRFTLTVKREISLLGAEQLEARLGVPVPDGVEWVAYQSRNEIVNRGKNAWTRKGGLLSVWILAMFPPAPDAWAIVPFEAAAKGPLVNDAYFGKVPTTRLIVDQELGALFFRCDGQLRSKIGLAHGRAKPVLGSYSRSLGQLTLVHYDLPKGTHPYVNSMWEEQKRPYQGDVVNSYNDGPTEPGKPALGGFYELETSSPGAELGPGKSIVHHHRTFHFVGDEALLDGIARAVLGVPLGKLPEAR